MDKDGEVCIGEQEGGGGISVVDTRERCETSVRVVNTEKPVRVKGRGRRARRGIYTNLSWD